MNKFTGLLLTIISAVIFSACSFFDRCLLLPSPTDIPLTHQATSVSTSNQPLKDLRTALFDISWDDFSWFSLNLNPSRTDDRVNLGDSTVYHLYYQLSDPPTSLSGVVEIFYTNTEKAALNEIAFAVFPDLLGGSMKITYLGIDGKQSAYSTRTGFLHTPLSQALQPGGSLIFHIEFEVRVPEKGGEYYYGIFGYNEGILSLAHAYPVILVYDIAGWDDQIPDLDGDPLSSDASYYLVVVDAPADLVLAASGIEVGRQSASGRQQVLFANGPSRDFYLAASKEFSVQTRNSNGITIKSYGTPGLSFQISSALEIADEAFQDFNKRYGPYPYNEFELVPIVTSAGGVEFPGITSLSLAVYDEPTFFRVVIAHEIAHQWFYNLVGNSSQKEPWLDESLAEFLTWQYFLDQYGPTGANIFQEELQSLWNRADSAPTPIGNPVSSYSTAGYPAIVYGRGPLFLIALREEMGIENFDAFMKIYAANYSWKIATTADFMNLAQETCGCDLQLIFSEWVTP